MWYVSFKNIILLLLLLNFIIINIQYDHRTAVMSKTAARDISYERTKTTKVDEQSRKNTELVLRYITYNKIHTFKI
jgi:hypothetical protein